MLYRSTRGAEGMMTSALAIKSGIAQDGGLYVPVHFPKFSQDELLSMQDLGYNALATKILALYLSDYNEFEITKMLARAYDPEKFGGTEPTPLKVINLDMGILELWHGPTCAFKDMALQLLPHMLNLVKHGITEKKTAIGCIDLMQIQRSLNVSMEKYITGIHLNVPVIVICVLPLKKETADSFRKMID